MESQISQKYVTSAHEIRVLYVYLLHVKYAWTFKVWNPCIWHIFHMYFTHFTCQHDVLHDKDFLISMLFYLFMSLSQKKVLFSLICYSSSSSSSRCWRRRQQQCLGWQKWFDPQQPIGIHGTPPFRVRGNWQMSSKTCEISMREICIKHMSNTRISRVEGSCVFPL